MKHGFFVVQGETQEGHAFASADAIGPLIFEVRNGKPVATAFISAQIITKLALGAKLVALGDATTMNTAMVLATKGLPWHAFTAPVTAPAALCADVMVRGYA